MRRHMAGEMVQDGGFTNEVERVVLAYVGG